jgi:hypothetical protein
METDGVLKIQSQEEVVNKHEVLSLESILSTLVKGLSNTLIVGILQQC